MDKSYYRKRLVDLRASIAREREAKKRDNANYARLVKQASSTSSRAAYRKSKIDRSASHDREIERLKRLVSQTQDAMRRC